MFKIKEGYLEINTGQLKNKIIYSDRNGVYNGLKIEENSKELIRSNINNINSILGGKLIVISNESEDCKEKVINSDKINGLKLDINNYKLSTESAKKFIVENLGSKLCYYIGNKEVGEDIENMGLNIINISENIDDDILNNNLPVLFARPPFAINSRYQNDNQIENNIMQDISIQNLIKLINRNKPKIIFCHSKANCERTKNNENFRELNLGYYFQLLINNYGYQKQKNIFDLGKGDQSEGNFFNTSLPVINRDYSEVIGIGDMVSDIEYTIENGGIGILVNSGDGINNEEIINKLSKYKQRFYNITDLSYLKLI